MKKIEVVVVTYNRKEMLVQCLEAILNQTYEVKRIIIVDNNSTDGTEEYLKERGLLKEHKISFHRLDTNTGGAGGFYAGMKLTRESVPDWVWIMDDDVIPEKSCLEELIKADEVTKEEVSFYASSIRNKDGLAMNVPKINRDQFTKYTDWYQYLEFGMVRIVKATFVSLLINGKAIQKCGLPWAPFFIWGDDSEYTQRIIRDFGPAYMVGKSKAIHLRGSAEELSLVKETNVNRIPMYFYLYRNNLIGFWEFEGVLYRFLCMGKLWYDFLMVILKGKYKWKKMGVIVKAFLCFLLGTYGRASFSNREKL